MYVEFGNSNAIEGYRDPLSEDPDLVRYRPIDGEQITTIVFPEGIGLQEAFTTAVATVGLHFAVADEESGERHKPAWVESDSDGLRALLCEHYGLKPSHTRPKNWGKETGANEAPSLARALLAPAKED